MARNEVIHGFLCHPDEYQDLNTESPKYNIVISLLYPKLVVGRSEIISDTIDILIESFQVIL